MIVRATGSEIIIGPVAASYNRVAPNILIRSMGYWYYDTANLANH